ncbi:MAG: hypothetical protein ACTSP4_13640 [Candidatus Hodarchaeales archaeon]
MTDEIPADILMYVLSEIIKHANTMKIDYEGILRSYSSLESTIGEIPVISIADRILEMHKQKIYLDLMKNYQSTLKQLFGVGARRADNQPWFIPLKKEITTGKEGERKESLISDTKAFNISKALGKVSKLFLPASNQDLLNCYLREYEIVNKMFVEPVWMKLREYKQFKPPLVKGSREKRRITNIRQFLEESEELRNLSFLLLQMNTDLRNAVVHLSYYIDSEKKAIIYFYEEEDEMKEIERNVLSLENAFDFLNHVRDEKVVDCC